ncbi:WD40/YVTN/BNR-like repeat-containing protein [Halomicrococcus sp. SG-WS-1]|uniref:WD40/YVTN/BNR-like repeat-containing protein n=1 Tax=Halomicrococcus sp. SG-WS-1 TaxID=3439057 RepID=UPI003F79E83D
MNGHDVTRRRFLQVSSTAVAAGAVPAASASESDWSTAETPTASTLYDVEYTASGAYAVGAGGVALHRTGEGWRTAFDGGVTGNGNSLYGADVTDDGERLWVVGASGAVGEYDVETGDLRSHSAPTGSTNNFNDVAVTGPAGEANVYVAGDSGKIYYSFENGEDQTWEYVTPGSGSAVSAVDFHDVRAGHAVDTNGRVFQTTDGVTWNGVGIGDANVTFYGVDSDALDDVRVSGGGGKVFHYDGAQWTSTDLGDAGLRDVESENGDGFTVGGGGKLFDQTNGTWAQDRTPTGQNLEAAVRGSTDVAVGAGGIVLER